jgi:hypothetical protein
LPIFTLIIAFIFFAAIALLIFGISRWKQTVGKIAVILSTIILLLFAVAIVLVLIAVGSGSMG